MNRPWALNDPCAQTGPAEEGRRHHRQRAWEGFGRLFPAPRSKCPGHKQARGHPSMTFECPYWDCQLAKGTICLRWGVRISWSETCSSCPSPRREEYWVNSLWFSVFQKWGQWLCQNQTSSQVGEKHGILCWMPPSRYIEPIFKYTAMNLLNIVTISSFPLLTTWKYCPSLETCRKEVYWRIQRMAHSEGKNNKTPKTIKKEEKENKEHLIKWSSI